MPKSKPPPDLGTERGERRQEQPDDHDERGEQQADSLRRKSIGDPEQVCLHQAAPKSND